MNFYRNKNQRHKAIAITAAVIIAVGTGLLSGCSLGGNGAAEAARVMTSPPAGTSTAAAASASKTTPPQTIAAAYEDFKELADKNPAPSELLKFLSENIGKVSKEEASQMAMGFETAQLKAFADFQEKINGQSVQAVLSKSYKPGFDLNDPKGFGDEKTKKAIQEIRDNGYKIDTAEGMFYPVIDYSVYKSFDEAVTPDMKDYFNLMAVESDKAAAKDAALVIGWDEMLGRARAQQKFLDTWETSPKAGEVGRILKNYAAFTIYGLNNTPLFDYETGRMDPKARDAYEKAVRNGGEGKYFDMLSNYMKKIKESDYKLTASLKKYREEINTEF